MEITNQTPLMAQNTAHAADCRMTFGRRDPSCPRCRELLAGAEPRRGWGSRRAADDVRRIREIRDHDCRKSGCGPVCTFGDW